MKKKNTNTVGSNYFFHTLYQVITLLTPLVTTPYISRVLSPEGIGQYSFYYTFVQYFIYFGNLGFSTYGQIAIAKKRDNHTEMSKTFWEIFIFRFAFFAIFSLIYLIFCFLSDNTQIMLIFFGLMVSGAIDISWVYFGTEDFKSISIRNIFVKFLSIVCIFLFVKTRADILIYAAILTLSTLVGSLLIWKNVNHIVNKPNFQSFEYKKHFKPALEFFIPSIAVMIYTMADKTMIGLITQSSYQNGLYEQAHKIEQLCVQFLLSISVVYRSNMARLFANNDYSQAYKNIKNAMNTVLFISFPICAGLIAVARDLIGWFLGEQYLECIPLLRVFAVLLVVISISNCMSNMFLSVTDKQDKFRKGTYIGAIVNIACNAILIPIFYSLGAAIASIIGETALLLFFYHYSKQYFRICDYKQKIIQYFIFCLIMISVIQIECHFLEPYKFESLFIEIVTGVIVYMIMLFAAKDQMLFQVFNIIKDKLHPSSG